jgi:hypothetical protein
MRLRERQFGQTQLTMRDEAVDSAARAPVAWGSSDLSTSLNLRKLATADMQR